MLFSAVEALVVPGEKAEAAKLYSLVLEGLQTGTVLRFDLRLLDMGAGIAADAGVRWVEAEQHFQSALRRGEELLHILGRPEARRLPSEAIDMDRRIGMPKHIELTGAVLRDANTPADDACTRSDLPADDDRHDGRNGHDGWRARHVPPVAAQRAPRASGSGGRGIRVDQRASSKGRQRGVRIAGASLFV